jgi:hypothetical protein
MVTLSTWKFYYESGDLCLVAKPSAPTAEPLSVKELPIMYSVRIPAVSDPIALPSTKRYRRTSARPKQASHTPEKPLRKSRQLNVVPRDRGSMIWAVTFDELVAGLTLNWENLPISALREFYDSDKILDLRSVLRRGKL